MSLDLADWRRTVADLYAEVRAYHPSCAYDPRWSCPLAPAGSRLDAEVVVGERSPLG